jgi:pimeloyl-ACP methyl ester carboxylesterase
MARDLLELLDFLAWDSFHMTGISLYVFPLSWPLTAHSGGMISQQLALQAPHRIRSWSLINTLSRGWTGLPPWRGLCSSTKLLFTRDETSKLDHIIHMTYGRDTHDDPTRYRRIFRELHREMCTYGPPDASGIARQFSAVVKHSVCDDAWRGLRDAHIPTLVVVGADDGLISPSHSMHIASLMEVHPVVFENGGHNLPWESPERLNAVLLRHYQSTSRGEQAIL